MSLTKKQANIVLLVIFAAIAVFILVFRESLAIGWYKVIFYSQKSTISGGASETELRQAAEKLVAIGIYDETGEFLEENGTIDSVPYLIEGLKSFTDLSPGEPAVGGQAVVLDALRKITGYDKSKNYQNYEEWKKWWDETGCKMDRNSFPIQDEDEDDDLPPAMSQSQFE